MISAWILLTASHYQFNDHHIRIVNKVLVYSDAVLIESEVSPILVPLYDSISLLEEDNVRYDLIRARSINGVIG